MADVQTERAIRARLGIPEGAERILILAESSHWDPNWLLTSEEYYRLRIRRVLDRAVRELEADPRRIFSVECVFFLKMYWERRIEKREAVRRLVNKGRLRLTGSGMTTPDTLLPETEAILRDYVMGQEWLRENGMVQEPRLAYLPDDFGHSPTVPTLLNALGYTMASVCRIDGSFFPGSDYVQPSWFPRPGSSAELLSRELKTADFVWVGPDGSSVLCHWNPFTYGQGDMIAARGVIRWMGLTFGLPNRSIKQVSKKIDSYVRQLAPLARTPYFFCPIGFDFNSPIHDLPGLLDTYNRAVYPESGVFAVNAGLDDYLDLVFCHRELLPELSLDMTPYWMGFYSARPEMKQRCKKIVNDLVTAEKLLASSEDPQVLQEHADTLESAWETAVLTNHHDFIPGTSPDRVWRKEQRPWLIDAQKRVDRVMEKAVRVSPVTPPPTPEPRTPEWTLRKGRLRVQSDHYVIEIAESSGGCIRRWLDPATGEELLAGPGNDAVTYFDSGGLWRIGHEYVGGVFSVRERLSKKDARMQATEKDGVLHVEITSALDGRRLTREMWFRDDSPMVRMRLLGSANKRKTVTCRFSTPFRPERIDMDVPGGVVSRPPVKIYDPTFWPAASFAHLRDPRTGRGLAVFLGGPACLSANGNGVVEWIVLRNAPKERAFGCLPLLAHPAYGEDNDEHPFDYAVGYTREGDWRTNRLHVFAPQVLGKAWTDPDIKDPAAMADGWISTSSEDVRVIAVKRAHRGEGLVVRLLSFGADRATLQFRDRPIKKAVLCDARERDIEEIRCVEGRVEVPLAGAIVSVRTLLS